MTEAQEAISELLSALDEYGSDITLRKVTIGTYNPDTGASTTVVDTVLRAFINRTASLQTLNATATDSSISGYSSSIMLYHTEEPKTSWKLLIKGQEYKIVYVAPFTLQNTVYKYEILIKK